MATEKEWKRNAAEYDTQLKGSINVWEGRRKKEASKREEKALNNQPITGL